MSTSRLFLIAWLCVVCVHSLHAFSPYESHLIKGRGQQVGLLGGVAFENREKFRELLSHRPSDLSEQLAKQGIRNLTLFEKQIDGSDFCFAHFYFESSEREAAVEAFTGASPWLHALSDLLKPQAGAETSAPKWLRMEWISFLPGNPGKAAKEVSRIGLVTGLKSEQEASYRSLCQTIWPGVSDQMARSKIRDWTTFVVGIGEKLYLFSYYEYVGDDFEADMARMKENPVVRRWLKLIEACQLPLPEIEGKGMWCEMAPILLPE